MAVTVEQLVNQGLLDAGIRYRVGSVYEGSPEAKVALEIYGQTRDEMLRLNDWSFSRKIISLFLLKGPSPGGGYDPTQPWSDLYPNPPWRYSYQYPGDCLDFRGVIEQPWGLPDLDPIPQNWRIDSDPLPSIVAGVATGPPAKVVLCNLNNAMGVYRAQITDPTEFDTGFTRALIAELGKKFSAAFSQGVSAVSDQRAEAVVAKEAGSDVRG